MTWMIRLADDVVFLAFGLSRDVLSQGSIGKAAFSMKSETINTTKWLRCLTRFTLDSVIYTTESMYVL
jgi:hypothetical protein